MIIHTTPWGAVHIYPRPRLTAAWVPPSERSCMWLVYDLNHRVVDGGQSGSISYARTDGAIALCRNRSSALLTLPELSA